MTTVFISWKFLFGLIIFAILFWIILDLISVFQGPNIKFEPENGANPSHGPLDFCDSPLLSFDEVKNEMKRHNTIEPQAKGLITVANNRVRLGNLMFLYASVMSIARTLNSTLIIEENSNFAGLLDVFQVSAPVVSTMRNRNLKWNSVNFQCCCCHNITAVANLKSQNEKQRKNWKVFGYLQSHHYFTYLQDKIKTEFRCRYSLQLSAFQRKVQVLSKFCNRMTCKLVGIHVRREDFKVNPKVGISGLFRNTKSYLTRAIRYLENKFTGEDLIFVVLGDDVDWNYRNLRNLNNIRSKLIVLDSCSFEQDFCFLSIMDHVIMTAGTFGWWAGYLAGGEVIYYKSPNDTLTDYQRETSSQLYYPSNWVGL